MCIRDRRETDQIEQTERGGLIVGITGERTTNSVSYTHLDVYKRQLLEHALLVVHDDRRSIEVEQALQTVVAVDHATVQIVQVGSRKAVSYTHLDVYKRQI